MMTELTLFTTLALHHLIIGCALTLCLMLVNYLLKTSAEMRSWIWMTAFIAATLIPFSLFVPDTILPIEVGFGEDVQRTVIEIESKVIIVDGITVEHGDWHVPSEFIFMFQGFLSLFILVWFIGSLWRSISVFRSFKHTRQIIAASKPLTLTMPYCEPSTMVVFTSDLISSPMVTGLFSTKIVVPENIINNLSRHQLAPILLHEKAHIERKDIWFGFFQELIAIIFWWSPVIRILNRKIHIERELACDLRAAKKMRNGKQYAQSLIDCAKLMLSQHRNLLAMGLFSQKKELSHRINEVLRSPTMKSPSLFIIMVVCLGLTTVTIKAAQNFAPKISLDDVQSDSRHFSLMSQRDGKKLVRAVDSNDLESIRQMIAEGMDINTPAIGDGTALILAVKMDNKVMVEALLSLGADVNQSSRGDGNPLIAAAMNNNIVLAELLIGQGADVNRIVPRDETPLINASRRGYLKMSQLLVSHGADVNLAVQTGWSDDYQIRSPLNQARTKEMTDFLVNLGATN